MHYFRLHTFLKIQLRFIKYQQHNQWLINCDFTVIKIAIQVIYRDDIWKLIQSIIQILDKLITDLEITKNKLNMLFCTMKSCILLFSFFFSRIQNYKCKCKKNSHKELNVLQKPSEVIVKASLFNLMILNSKVSMTFGKIHNKH